MKILIIGNFSFEKYGGASTIVNYLIEGYKEAGFEVAPFSFPQKNSKLRRVFSQFLDVINLPALSLLKKVIIDINPDVIHIHNIHNDISAYSIKMIKNMNIPVIVTFHDFWALCSGFNLEKKEGGELRCRKPISRFEIKLPFRNFIIRSLVTYADYIFLPSDFALNQFMIAGYSIGKLKMIYNGIDLEKFKPKSHSDNNRDNINILFVGRPTKKKGIEWLKGVCDKLKRDGLPINLKIVGGKNSVSYDELPFIYQNSDILVQPSLVCETFGLTVLEGMASGLPVVISNMGGMHEVLGEIGFVVESDDKDNLENSLMSLISDWKKREDLGKKGRLRAEKYFSKRIMINEYLKYIENL